MTNYITDENYLDIMVENAVLDLYKDLPVTYLNIRDSMVHIKIDRFNECLLGTYSYYNMPTCYILESTQDLDAAGVTKVQQNPNLRLFGTGVLIAIIDTGVEYTHQALRYSDGSTRIATIWDQTIEDSQRVPVGFGYGATYSKEDINEALKQENPLLVVPSTDTNGHGTMLAGIAAGSAIDAQEFQGVAPMSELIVVKCKTAKKYNREIFMIGDNVECYQETDIIMGIRFATEYANEGKKPIALCLAIGSSQEGHAGYNALGRYIDFLTQNPRCCITISAGNEGNNKRHYYGAYTSLNTFVEFEMNVDQKDPSFTTEIWQNSVNRAAIQVISPTGESTEIVYPRINECNKFTFIFISTQLWINNILIELDTGKQLILVRFADAQPGIWKFRVYNVDNSNADFHAWLPAGSMLSRDTFFLNPNPYTTVTSPGNAILTIASTAYNTRDNSIWEEASRGYSVEGIVLPDIASPGVNLLCPTLKNTFTTGTGTGLAAAFTTGAAALILEWGIVNGKYPTLNGADIKQMMIRGAVRDSTPTAPIEYPNQTWGYGKLNVYEIFNKLI